MTHCPSSSFDNQASAEAQYSGWEILGKGDIMSQDMLSLLNEFKKLAPEADELYKCLEKVIEDYQKNLPGNMDHLKQLMLALNEAVKLWHGKKGKSYSLSSMVSKSTESMVTFVMAKKVKVYPVVAGKTIGAHEEILNKVKVVVCTDPSDCDVVVIFCPVISRVSSDVDDAMRKIPEAAASKSVILVVMHHSRKDINPPELNHGHQNIILDLHVVFHETVNGLLKCERNELAIQFLQEMFKNFQT